MHFQPSSGTLPVSAPNSGTFRTAPSVPSGPSSPRQWGRSGSSSAAATAGAGSRLSLTPAGSASSVPRAAACTTSVRDGSSRRRAGQPGGRWTRLPPNSRSIRRWCSAGSGLPRSHVRSSGQCGRRVGGRQLVRAGAKCWKQASNWRTRRRHPRCHRERSSLVGRGFLARNSL